MKQQALSLNQDGPFVHFIGKLFPFLLRPRKCCRAVVKEKRIVDSFVPTGMVTSHAVSRGVLELLTDEGLVTITVEPIAYELIHEGDTLPIWYQKSRLYDVDRSLKAEVVRVQ